MEDREKQLIEKERSILLEAIDVMPKATPLVIFYLKISHLDGHDNLHIYRFFFLLFKPE